MIKITVFDTIDTLHLHFLLVVEVSKLLLELWTVTTQETPLRNT